MDIVYIVIGWALLVIGTLGCFIPVLPGPPIAYVALLLAYAAGTVSGTTLLVAGAVTIAVLVLDCFVPAIGARKFNCSKAGIFGCLVGTVIGLFFLPFGIIVGAFLGALLGETVIAKKDLGPALRGAFGAILGYIAGIVLKLACCGYLAYCFYKAA